jgi:hypothetical protein
MPQCTPTQHNNKGKIKNAIMTFVEKWIKLEIIILNEISHTKKDKYQIFSLTCPVEEK